MLAEIFTVFDPDVAERTVPESRLAEYGLDTQPPRDGFALMRDFDYQATFVPPDFYGRGTARVIYDAPGTRRR